jgi:hypothetical protein
MKGGTKVLDCKANGGDCVPGTCDITYQLPALSDKAAGCGDGQLCCINITPSKHQIDPACAKLKFGDSCGKLMYCDGGLKCITKCEFCAINFNAPEGRPDCNVKIKNVDTINPFFQNISNMRKTLSCGCTKIQCDAKTKTGECSTAGYCPSVSSTAQNYACCTPPDTTTSTTTTSTTNTAPVTIITEAPKYAPATVIPSTP